MLSTAYLVHGSASQVNCSDDDAQVISCHCYLVIFHVFVEQLTSFSSLPIAVLDLHCDGIVATDNFAATTYPFRTSHQASTTLHLSSGGSGVAEGIYGLHILRTS